jgi:hypothetical protein
MGRVVGGGVDRTIMSCPNPAPVANFPTNKDLIATKQTDHNVLYRYFFTANVLSDSF